MQPRIMVVDDELLMCEILKDRLEACGFSVIVANDGHSALALLTLETKHTPIPLVLLDVNMPGLDGFSVLRRMRASYPEIAVLMMSASLDDNYPAMARHLGAQGWLQKPLDFPLVLEHCRTLLGPDALP